MTLIVLTELLNFKPNQTKRKKRGIDLEWSARRTTRGIYNFLTQCHMQTLQTQIRLFLKEQKHKKQNQGKNVWIIVLRISGHLPYLYS